MRNLGEALYMELPRAQELLYRVFHAADSCDRNAGSSAAEQKL